MADEGSTLEMTELILEEKELKAKLAAVEQQLEEPKARLEKAKAIYEKAKAAVQAAIEEVKPLASDKTLLEGELELLAEKKSKLRQESRLLEAGGIRPGTQAFVEQMNQLAGDPEEARMKKAARDLEVDAALAALKGKVDTPE